MASLLSPEEWRGLLQQGESEPARQVNAPDLDARAIAGSIDHTLLRLDTTREQINLLCAEARGYAFKSVCVRLNWVEQAVQNLQGSPVAVTCVIGFPEGTYPSKEKALEAESAVKLGAMELDMVINYVWLREKRYQEVLEDIVAVRRAAPQPIILKVILETAVLSREDIVTGCKIAEMAKADFVKTSTGFNGQGATVENVRLMKATVGPRMKVKASGGVKTMKDLKAMKEAGADRIGASSGVAIMKEAEGEAAEPQSHTQY